MWMACMILRYGLGQHLHGATIRLDTTAQMRERIFQRSMRSLVYVLQLTGIWYWAESINIVFDLG
jgi:hypothetical protein